MQAKVTTVIRGPIDGAYFDRGTKTVPEEQLRAVIDDIIRRTCCEYYDTTPADDRAVIELRVEFLDG